MSVTSVSLYGPFPLKTDQIDRAVAINRIGVYLLGPINQQGQMTVKRVGRSDTDLNGRLKQYGNSYSHFIFGYCGSAKEAFEEECRLYHFYKPVNNPNHPDKPTGTNFWCPVPGCSK